MENLLDFRFCLRLGENIEEFGKNSKTGSADVLKIDFSVITVTF